MIWKIIHDNCLNALKNIEPNSIDAIITDPPYPEIDREYGKMTEEEWHNLMDDVIVQSKRILKPKGSAVFILQPNWSQRGKMRLWLWEFLVKTAKNWNMIQNAYWWRIDAMPSSNSGLLRNSVKYCLWFGEPDCYRNQDKVLWDPAKAILAETYVNRCLRYGTQYSPSGNVMNKKTMLDGIKKKGGVTPFNLLPMSNNSTNHAGHPAGTPHDLLMWWVKYICPEKGIVLDPFSGAGTTGVCAIKYGCDYIGIEKEKKYCEISETRLSELKT